jgi:exoribonuclease R
MHDIAKRLPHLPESVLDYTVRTLCAALPIPVPDTPENRAARDAAAIDAFIALNPANAAEAMLAEFTVAAEATAAWCAQQATRPGITPAMARRYTRQANSMLKFARSMRRDLSRSKPPPSQRREVSPPAAPTPSDKRAAAAKAERAARIRALDLRLIRMPHTMH